MSTKPNRTRVNPARKPTNAKPPAKRTTKAATKRKAARSAPSPTGSKQSQLIALLRSPAGSTIEQMTELTGWQPHTVRGTISGVLRKRLGLQVSSELPCDGGARVYRIVGAAA